MFYLYKVGAFIKFNPCTIIKIRKWVEINANKRQAVSIINRVYC